MRVFAVLLLAALAGSASGQEVYKWTDAQGVVHFSDRKPAGQTAQGVQIAPAPPSAAAAVEAPAHAAPTPPAAIPKRPINITMYSTADCGYCAQARRFFAANHLRYAERDIGNNQNRAKWKQLGGNGVPLFVINGQVSGGFSAESMTQRLHRIGW
jgi:glutaredoxin